MTKNKLIRIVTALTCEPWLIPPAMHETLSNIVFAHRAGGETEAIQHEFASLFSRDMPNENDEEECYAIIDGVAVVPVEGVIARKFSNVLNSSGVVSIDVLDGVLKQLEQDVRANSILLSFDSPGGTARGVAETAKTIKEVNQTKTIISYADGMMDSAAYWLASQSSAIYATESADVGSIGVYMAILDRSRQAELQGIKVDVIKSGKHKGMGYPGTKLTDEQRQLLQDDVDKLGAQFRQVVREGRASKEKVIVDEVMQGQSFDSGAAMANGLIDGIMSKAEVLSLASEEGMKQMGLLREKTNKRSK